jgi:hypothetical protein
MTLASELSRRQADETLAELAGIRRRTRRAVGTLWFPLVLFGSLTLLEIPFELTVGPPVIAFFWLVAGPVGSVLVGRHLRREGRLRGMTGRPPAGGLLGAGICAGCFLLGLVGGWAGGERGALAAAVVWVTVGYLVLARLTGRPVLGTTMVAVAAVVLALGSMSVPVWGMALAFGTGQLAAGAAFRRREAATA